MLKVTQEALVNHSGLLHETMEMLSNVGSAANVTDLVSFPSDNGQKGGRCIECPDEKRCDQCLNDIYDLKNMRRSTNDHVFAKNMTIKYRHIVKVKDAWDNGQFSERIAYLLYQLIKRIVT